MDDNDGFEASLRDLLKTSEEPPSGDDARLNRVLKTANRQVGIGELFRMMRHWLNVSVIAIGSGKNHLTPVSRIPKSPTQDRN